jgi:hypothetical protein
MFLSFRDFQNRRHGDHLKGKESGCPEELIRKPSRGHTQDPANGRFLNDSHNPKRPSIRVAEIDGYIPRDSAGFIHFPDCDKSPQDGNVFQSSSGVLSAAYLRLIAVVGYRQEKAR